MQLVSVANGKPFDFEARLAVYLPGLDVRLLPVSRCDALVAAHLFRALEIQYGRAAVAPILRACGAASWKTVGPREAIQAYAKRDEAQCRRPPMPPAARLAGLDWHLAFCKVDAAWRLLGGPDAISWQDIMVGHIDTGYSPHRALGFPDQTWVRTDLARTIVPASAPNEPGSGVDNLQGRNAGHGTSTSSVIAGHWPEQNFYGVAPRVPIVPVRICDCVIITNRQAEFAEAVRYLVQTPGVRVINVSLAVFLGISTKALREAVDLCYDQGVVLVCAAGNTPIPPWVVSPARLQRSMALAGVTRAGIPWGGSSYGPQVDLSAPAFEVRRAEAGSGQGLDDGGDGGTSFAAAIITGAAALWFGHHRSRLPALYSEPWQWVEAFKHCVTTSTWQPSGWLPGGGFGSGVLDAESLLNCHLPPTSTLRRDSQNA